MEIIITQELLQEIFDYKDGQLIWIKKSCPKARPPIGEIAGHVGTLGYRTIRIFNKRFMAHRLVYLYHHGYIVDTLQIDHINRLKDDNRIENLRLVTAAENSWNREDGAGWSYESACKKKYRARIRVHGKKIELGYFDTPSEASLAYMNARKHYHTISR